MADTAKRPTKVGTKITEVIIGSAAAKMQAATKAMVEAFNNSGKLETLLSEYSLKIADSEDKLAGLQLDYEHRKAENDFRLNLEYKTNEAEFAKRFLDENGKTAMDSEDLAELTESHNDLKKNFAQKVASEVNASRGIMEKDYLAAKALDAANYSLKEAENVAKIKALETQLSAANQMVEVWKGQLEAERAAGVKRAEASSIGTLNVGAGAR